MEKWADFLISGVRYDKDRTWIQIVERRDDLGGEIGPPKEIARSLVVEDLEFGRSYRTIFSNEEGRWEPGPHLRLVLSGGSKLLRTDNRETERDNLGRLPGI